MIRRGQVFWADFGPAIASPPAQRRPVLVVQSDAYWASALSRVRAVVVTSNTSGGHARHVFLPPPLTGLPRRSVANVTALVTLDEADLSEASGAVAAP